MTHESTLPPRRGDHTSSRDDSPATPEVLADPVVRERVARSGVMTPSARAVAGSALARLRASASGAFAAPDVRATLGLFVASRLGFLLVTYVGYVLILAPKYSSSWVGTPGVALSWNQWDAVHYLGIAQHGYVAATDTAFFPLYPLLIHIVAFPFGAGSTYWVGLVLSNLAFLGAMLVLARLIAPLWGPRVAALAMLYLTLFPTALYTFAPYNESLFLLTSLGCFLALQRRRWALAGILGGLAALTRAAGVLLLIPFVLAWCEGRGTVWLARVPPRVRALLPQQAASEPMTTRGDGDQRTPLSRGAGEGLGERLPDRLPNSRANRSNARAPFFALAWVLLIPVGLGLYAAFCAVRFGDPLAFSHAQASWNRVNAPPWIDFLWQLQGLHRAGPASFYQVHDLLDLAAAVFCVAMLVVAWRRLPVGQTLYLAALLLLVLTVPGGVASHLNDPMTSVSRFALEMFPAFIMLALLTVDRPRWREGILICSTLLLATLSLVFILGRWLV